MSAFKISKKANEPTKMLIYGFIKAAQKELNILLNNIPIPIQQYIVAYYYLHEYFYKAPDNHFEISDNKLTITNIKNTPHQYQVWMNQSVSSLSDNIFTWRFKINKLKDGINFGIVPSKHCVENCMDFWFWEFRPVYSITNKQCIHKYPWKETDCHLIRDMTPNSNLAQLTFGSGDEVSLTLNIKESTINCTINDDPSFNLFTDIEKHFEELNDIEWKLIFSMGNKDDCITLLNFYQHS